MNQELDWNEMWKKAVLASSWRKRRYDPTVMWDKRARQFAESASRTDRARRFIEKIRPGPEDTVLDIGAGPGTNAIPLARLVKKVTAIDPSTGMLEYLGERAKREGLGNITLINKKWEDVEIGKDIERHDVVIASHSFSAMPDIKDSLSRMNTVARRGAYLLTIAGKQTWGYGEIWPKVHGEAYVPGPDYIYLVNTLYQMEIYADVEISDYEFDERFSSLEEAVVYWKNNTNAPDTPAMTEIIRDHVSKHLIRQGDVLLFRHKSKAAMIWWKKT